MKKKHRILLLIFAILLISCLLILLPVLQNNINSSSSEPAGVLLYDTPFTLTNANGQILQYENQTAGGDMPIIQQNTISGGENGDEVFFSVPYSDTFTLLADFSPISIGIETKHYQRSVQGTGIHQVELDRKAGLRLLGEDMEFQVGLSLPILKPTPYGLIRFSGRGKDEVSIQPTAHGFSLEGMDPSLPILLSCTAVDFAVDALNLGTIFGKTEIDLSQLQTNGTIVVFEEGKEARSIFLD